MALNQKTFIPIITWDENRNVIIKGTYYEDILPYLPEIPEAIPSAIFDEQRFLEIFEEIRQEKNISTEESGTADGNGGGSHSSEGSGSQEAEGSGSGHSSGGPGSQGAEGEKIILDLSRFGELLRVHV